MSHEEAIKYVNAESGIKIHVSVNKEWKSKPQGTYQKVMS
jgi:hypothetical protein